MSAPIGIFDSGIGGVSVLKQLQAKLPEASFIYLGDTARLPYGSKSQDTIRKYTIQNIQFLKKQGVQAVVLACNSASAAWIENPQEMGIPIFNVVQPAARAALASSPRSRVGVIATRATVGSLAYPNAIKHDNSQAEVFQVPCPLLVPLVEEGWLDDPITNLISFRYLDPLKRQDIDSLILGCTHYPFLRAAIQKVMGNSIELVDPGLSCAEEVADAIGSQKFSQPKQNRYFLTDAAPRFYELASAFLGGEKISPEIIDLEF